MVDPGATGEPAAVRFEISLIVGSLFGFIAEGYLVVRHGNVKPRALFDIFRMYVSVY